MSVDSNIVGSCAGFHAMAWFAGLDLIGLNQRCNPCDVHNFNVLDVNKLDGEFRKDNGYRMVDPFNELDMYYHHLFAVVIPRLSTTHNIILWPDTQEFLEYSTLSGVPLRLKKHIGYCLEKDNKKCFTSTYHSPYIFIGELHMKNFSAYQDHPQYRSEL
jgi:hypothetical protein